MSAHVKQVDESSDRRSHDTSIDTPRYSPYNWIEDDETESEDEPEAQSGHVETTGTTKEDSISHLILKQTSDGLIDPIALNAPSEEGMHDYKGQTIDLTDERVFPPTRRHLTQYTEQTHMQKKAPSTKTWRYSEVGHLTYGGIIPDRPKPKLRQTIDLFFDLVSTRVPPRTKSEIRERALEMKSDGDYHDTEIMRKVARWTFNPNELELEE